MSTSLPNSALQALPKITPWPNQRVVERAAQEGRTRGVASAVLDQIWREPKWAMRALSTTLRKAKFLHSGERRLVQEGCVQLIRHHHVIDLCLPAANPTSLQRWLSFLVLSGLSPEMANAQGGTSFDALTDIPRCLTDQVANFSEVELLAVVGSMGDDLAKQLFARLGTHSFDWIAASNQRAPVILRTNQERTTRDNLSSRLAAEGINTTKSTVAPQGLICEGRVNLSAIAAYRDGCCEVQDEASQLITALVPDVSGLVIDFCAGAGGKSLALAAARTNAISIVACDTRSHALDQLKKRVKRARSLCHIQSVEISADGPLPPAITKLTGQASLVMVDAPCTGTGVFRHHPDYRWQINTEALNNLPKLQLQILERAAPLVAPDGKLLYSTCSILPIENQDVINSFIRRNPGWRIEGKALELLPHRDQTDGFFGVVLAHE